MVKEDTANNKLDMVKHMCLTPKETVINVAAEGTSRRTALKELTRCKEVKLTMRQP